MSRIGIFTLNYHPLIGGVEAHARQIAHGFSAEHVVTIGAVNMSSRKVPHRLRVLGSNLLTGCSSDRSDGPVKVVSLASSPAARILMLPLLIRAVPRIQRWFYHEMNRATRPFYSLALRSKLRRVLGGCDVVHCLCSGDLGIAVEKEARALGLPVVCTPFVHPNQWGDGPDDIELYRRCDAVIGLVPSDRDYLAGIGVPVEKLRVVGVSPCLPEEFNRTAFRSREHLRDEPVVLYVGRMMAQKGAAVLVAAAARVWQAHPGALFYFAGPGGCDELAIFAGADLRIRYLGRISDCEKAETLAGCDVFCMPSASEILPTVYLEAWALGKPVIGGPARGLRELVEDSGGGFVSEQSAEPLARQLIRMLDDSELRRSCGEAGRKLVAENYSIEAVTSQLGKIYREVCERA